MGDGVRAALAKKPVRERGILFSGPMVRAILEGRKSQTRRVVKDLRVTLRHHVQADPPFSEPKAPPGTYRAEMNPHGALSVLLVDGQRLGVKPQEFDFVCPYADGHTYLRTHREGRKEWTIQPNASHLWVRETWGERDDGKVYYAADQELGSLWVDRWRPSIFMPRWASRLTLEVTEVRVQRLQDISEEDARAEGCPGIGCYRNPNFTQLVTDDGELPQEQFRKLWDSINADRAPWASNPWCWAISFRRLP